jgi:hypothetical protein
MFGASRDRDAHWRGIDSSVSVMLSPNLRSRPPPQQRQAVGPGTITRSRGRCSGNGLRAGRLRVKAATVVVVPGDRAFTESITAGPDGTLYLSSHLNV